jgi:hypothetical protein
MNIRATVGGAWVTTSCEGVWWKGASGTDAARSTTEHGCAFGAVPLEAIGEQLMLSMRRLVASIFMHTLNTQADFFRVPDGSCARILPPG